jgi:hypothetical protein
MSLRIVPAPPPYGVELALRAHSATLRQDERSLKGNIDSAG